jgi:hypothetical protein
MLVIKSSIFWDITWRSLLKVDEHFEGICHLHLQGWRKSQGRNQREAGSDMSLWNIANFQQQHIPDDRTPHNHYCENVKSYMLVVASDTVCGNFSKIISIYATTDNRLGFRFIDSLWFLTCLAKFKITCGGCVCKYDMNAIKFRFQLHSHLCPIHYSDILYLYDD